MVINALNSGASVFMADFEDANSPDLGQPGPGPAEPARRRPPHHRVHGARDGQELRAQRQDRGALRAAARLAPRREAPARSTASRSPAALFDFGLFFFHNAKEQLARGTGPYFYLPKMESHLEARLWNDVFVRAQEQLGVPRGTIKATCLIETLPAAFEMDEILYELREHSAGLNCGRWDYIFSFIKKRADDPTAILPDRGAGHDGQGASSRAYVAAPHQDLPPPRRPRDGRHGRADPDQGRRRPPTRRRSRRCAPTSCAR